MIWMSLSRVQRSRPMRLRGLAHLAARGDLIPACGPPRLRVMTEIRNRGTHDVLIAVVDGLELPHRLLHPRNGGGIDDAGGMEDHIVRRRRLEHVVADDTMEVRG